MDHGSLQIIRPAYKSSAIRADQYPQGNIPEIAFLGRSNVGKSSLINSLCQHRGLARVSGAPGKTQTTKYFQVLLQEKTEEEETRRQLYFVDLPGYGYARTGGRNRQLWSHFIGEYITSSPNLHLLFLLVDLRHPDLPIDREAYTWLADNEVPLQIIATKADKLKKNERVRNLAQIQKLFPTAFPPIAYSSLKQEGRNDVLHTIYEAVTDD